MQRHKRFAWTWAAAGVFSVMGLLGACDPAEKPRSNTGTRTGTGTRPPEGEVPRSATPVSFYAWGATDDERVAALVDMGAATDGFELKVEEVPLTTEPKQDTIGPSRVAYGRVVGGFGAPPTASTRPNGA